MIININAFQFVLSSVPAPPNGENERCVIVVRDTISNSEICMDMTKQQVATLSDAMQVLSR